MATWLAILLVVLALLILGLFTLGLLGALRARSDGEDEFRAMLEEANAALAAARAADRGWERGNLERAARAAHEARHPGSDISELHLVQVVDQPGTEADQARFRLVDADGQHDILLGRHGDDWVEVSA